MTVISRNCASDNCVSWETLAARGFPHESGNGIRAVVNVAGRNVLDPLKRWSDPEFRKEVIESRVGTAKRIAEAVAKLDPEFRPRVLVQVSGVGFYGVESPPREVGETSAGPKESDFFSRLVVDWEKAAKLDHLKATPPVRTAFIRPGVVLGRDGGMIKQLFWPFFFGLGGVSGSGHQFMPWIHVKDLSRLVIHCIESESAEGVYNGVAPEIVTNREFVQAFGKAMWRPAFIPVPEFLWNFVFGSDRADLILKGQKVLSLS